MIMMPRRSQQQKKLMEMFHGTILAVVLFNV